MFLKGHTNSMGHHGHRYSHCKSGQGMSDGSDLELANKTHNVQKKETWIEDPCEGCEKKFRSPSEWGGGGSMNDILLNPPKNRVERQISIGNKNSEQTN